MHYNKFSVHGLIGCNVRNIRDAARVGLRACAWAQNCGLIGKIVQIMAGVGDLLISDIDLFYISIFNNRPLGVPYFSDSLQHCFVCVVFLILIDAVGRLPNLTRRPFPLSLQNQNDRWPWIHFLKLNCHTFTLTMPPKSNLALNKAPSNIVQPLTCKISQTIKTSERVLRN